MSDRSVSPLMHDELIENSWRRCSDYGLTHQSQPDYQCLSRGELSALLEEHRQLVDTTQTEVLPYYDHILSNSNCMIVLADGSGHVLNTWGKERFHRRQHGLQIGNQWGERLTGTNAIGTAIATGQAVQVGREEHFLQANRYMTGSAAPIFNTRKQLVGVLDISSAAYLPQDHTLGMVKLMTLSVENRLITNAFAKDHWLITFNTNRTALDSAWSGLLAVDSAGRVVSANRRAAILLSHEVALQPVDQLFDCRMCDLKQQPESLPLAVTALGKYRMHLQVRRPAETTVITPDFRGHTALTASRGEPKSERPADVLSPDQLHHGDERVARLVSQAQRVMERDIPLLIQGETGSGKEVLVRTLHYFSQRSHQPLVAVNCAAIPSELVESELFGYARGAFTGASQKGSIGYLRKAHRGTLFLDEIGEMPATAQSRLLRVLQERRVTPVGSTESVAVEFKLVSATHRDLRQEVQAGRFRQDLFYRIAGLRLQLPALRERQDREALITFMYQRLAQAEGYNPVPPLDAALLRNLAALPWPGNLRQLHSALNVALVLADGEPLSEAYLPEDLTQNIKRSEAEDAAAAVSASDSTDNLAARIRRLYREYGGNVSRTARAAGVSRNTVYKYIQ